MTSNYHEREKSHRRLAVIREGREAAQMCRADPDLGRGFNEISAEVQPSSTAPSLRGNLLVPHPCLLLCVSAAGVRLGAGFSSIKILLFRVSSKHPLPADCIC